VDPRLGHGDGGPDVDALGDQLGEVLGHPVAVGVERDDPHGVGPLRMGADGRGRRGVGEIGPVDRVELPGGNGQRAVERVGPGMGPDHVALARIGDAADERPALLRAGGAPGDRVRRLHATARVGCQDDMLRRFRHLSEPRITYRAVRPVSLFFRRAQAWARLLFFALKRRARASARLAFLAALRARCRACQQADEGASSDCW
jgi:hypothetical protein